MKIVPVLLACALLGAGLWAVVSPVKDVWPIEKAFFVGVVQNSGPIRESISKQLLHSPGQQVQIDSLESKTLAEKAEIDYLTIDRNGSLTAFSKKAGAIILLSPTVSVGQVKWRCSGFPSDRLPIGCSRQEN